MSDHQETLIAEYLSKIPLLHSWDGGLTWNAGGFAVHHLRQLLDFIKLNNCLKIIETGAGNSTITFLLTEPNKLVSIAPEEALFERIRAECSQRGIADHVLDARIGISQWELPNLAQGLSASFDFALIDGAHGWPHVFVDFCYLNYLVRENGFIMIDDIQLYSIKQLRNFLSEQPGYRLALDLDKSLIFQKTTDDSWLPEWDRQPYIVRLST